MIHRAVWREQAFQQLQSTAFDLLVIGGGITGMGVAAEAARRGLTVALVEGRDFASGTSSRSTKLIHGGLRYLKERQFRLVRESVVERMRLMKMAPHLVRPEWFIFPVYKGDPDPLWMLHLGLWLYDRYAGRDLGTLGHRRLRSADVLSEEPLLRSEGLKGAAMYVDAVTDDARLTIAVMRQARAQGAVVLNRAEVVGFRKDAAGKITGVEIEDRFGDRDVITVSARKVLNASGPWADHVRRLDDSGSSRILLLTKGIHITVPKDRLPLRHVVVMRGTDGRMMFAVPRGAYVYAGTTDTVYDGDPAHPTVEAEDVRYVLAAIERTFPDVKIDDQDVVSTWAGIRPLIAPGDVKNPSSVSRDYQLFRSASGLLTVGGGKLTAYQAMARHIVDDVFPETKTKVREDGATGALPGGVDLPNEAAILAQAKRHELPMDQVKTLVAHFGSHYQDVLDRLAERDADKPPRIRVLRAVARYTVQEEAALSLEDVLVRRFPEALFSGDNGLDVAAEVSEALAEALGFSEEDRKRHLSAYRAFVQSMHAWKNGR